MRRLLGLLSFLFLIPLAHAQTGVSGGSIVRTFAGAPSNPCSKGTLAVNVATGGLYNCPVATWHLVGGSSSSGVLSFNTLVGDVTISAGTGISLTPAGNNIAIAATTAGVTSVNALTGAVVFAAGSNITLTPAGNTVTIAGTSSGTVTHTGTLTATAVMIGNGTADVKSGAPFKVTNDGINDVLGTNADASGGSDNIRFQVYNVAGNDSFSAGIAAGSSYLNAKTVTPQTLDLGDFPGDIIDSTGSHGLDGALMTSLGSGNGVQWSENWHLLSGGGAALSGYKAAGGATASFAMYDVVVGGTPDQNTSMTPSQISSNSDLTGAYASVSADDGLALSGNNIDLSDNSGGSWPGIIDSTNSQGTVGKFLGSGGSGNGVSWYTAPFVFYTNTATSQVAAVTDTTMLTVGGSSGAYRFSGTINCDTTSAAATATLNLKWTDTGSQAHTLTSVAACTALGASSFAQQVTYIRAKTGTTITWGVTIANTPTYDVDVRLETL